MKRIFRLALRAFREYCRQQTNVIGNMERMFEWMLRAAGKRSFVLLADLGDTLVRVVSILNTKTTRRKLTHFGILQVFKLRTRLRKIFN